MFRSRSSLQKKDRESGLAFNWRVPVSSAGTLVLAVVLVGGVAMALGFGLRIKFGEDRELHERRGTVILVPADAGGALLEQAAIEAGPFPSRWEADSDPGLAALREELLVEAESLADGRRYRPRLVEMDFGVAGGFGMDRNLMMALPPLPEPLPLPEVAVEPEVELVVRGVTGAEGAPKFELVGLPVPAAQSAGLLGTRFLVGFEADGSIREVVPLDPDEHGTAGMGWVYRGRVVDAEGRPGWLVVEYVLKP